MVDTNPYASPSEASNETEYYKFLLPKASFAEVRDISGSYFRAGLVFFFNALGLLPAYNIGIAVDQVLDTSHEAAPPSVRNELNTIVDELTSEGFSPIAVLHKPSIGAIVGYSFLCSHTSKQFWGAVNYMRSGTGELVNVQTGLSIMTRLKSDHVYVTTNSRPGLRGPSSTTSKHLIGQSVAQVLASHRETISTMDVMPIDGIEVVDMARRLSSDAADFHIQRGVYKRMTVSELQQMRDTVQNGTT